MSYCRVRALVSTAHSIRQVCVCVCVCACVCVCVCVCECVFCDAARKINIGKFVHRKTSVLTVTDVAVSEL